jgi:hypothetical protein
MTPIKPIKPNSKSKDLYESAWKSIHEDEKILDIEHWRQSGWKPIIDFPPQNRKRMKDRLSKSPDFENCIAKVRLPSGIRGINFFRPIITKQ